MPGRNDLSHLAEAKTAVSRRFLLADAGVVRALAVRRVVSTTPNINLQGVGIGFKLVSGRTTSEPALKFYVRRKRPKSEIGTDDLLPEQIDGIATDVEEIGFLQPLAPPPTHRRPAQPGCSTGFADPDPLNLLAGTFGALVEDSLGRYVLSNNHVLADQNRLPFGTAVFEPSPFDGGNTERDKIAELEGYVPLDASQTNYVDGAIARLVQPNLAIADILGIGPPVGVKSAALNTIVEKYGRTTGYTRGYVESISTDLKVPYDIGTILFHDQIAIKSIDALSFSEQGDSGALVLEQTTGMAVGLLFAGSPTVSFANHISDVLDSFGVNLVTS
ncbi:hypothetical protein [Rhizobium leguminosarum]|uniref:hypothetical protein n=1 Tax=Rhizobium leguminosarum TaxID=384 RepID=UPI001038A5CB|nr:hypothetical protein [Rhizobium leguminosarum]MBY5494504.1 hypothetical protein [Rhizobium leguminosarum]MBY5530246.1 hypothetical protein [Rhizobium leguminosarum]NKK46200.1 hypothetical protein [Rhizobium leguminosarum bv. viciae]TBY30715.1 hypothetical protein E0H55_20770 [Rhizobium leguminosarum bv. viciae]TBY31589.1 hypothetical protein E0H60_29875 [Rhizobium leguminosarum bv. viciae]